MYKEVRQIRFGSTFFLVRSAHHILSEKKWPSNEYRKIMCGEKKKFKPCVSLFRFV